MSEIDQDRPSRAKPADCAAGNGRSPSEYVDDASVNELLDSLPHIIWSAGPSGRAVFLSAQWKDFTGRDPLADLGEGWAGAIHPDDRRHTLDRWLECVRSATIFDAEFRLRSRSGDYRWFATKGLPQFGSAGELLCWRGTCTDVHDRVLAQQTLARSRYLQQTAAEKLRSTLDLMPQMVWSMEAGKRRPDFYNRRWYEFTGLPTGSVDGPEWAGLYHPDDSERALAEWRRLRKTGDDYACTYRLRARDGEYRWVRSEGTTHKDERGRIICWYGTCTDIHESVLQQRALEESEKRAQAILNSVPHVIWTARPDGSLDFLSEQWARTLFKGDSKNASDYAWLHAVHPDDLDSTIAAWKAATASSQPYETEFRVRWGPTDYRWIIARALPEIDEEGRTIRWYGTCTDVHDRVIAKQALHESERLSRGIINATPDCMSLLDADGKILFVNDAVLSAYAVPQASQLLGQKWGASFGPEVRRRANAELKRAQDGGVGRLTMRGGPTGKQWFDVLISPIRNDDATITKLLVSSRDVTEEKKAQEEAQWAANHDPLTGLPNRLLVQTVLDREIADAPLNRASIGLILLDADHLKRINDALGHDAGDAMLCEIANRLKAAVGTRGLVGRLGGDEFAVVHTGVKSEDDLNRIAQKLLADLKQPFSYAGRMLECAASGGTAIFGKHGRSRAELMKNADIALYAAKTNGRGNIRAFEPALRLALQRRDSMLNLASSALTDNRITAHYQPKVDLRTGKVAGVEALLRWQHGRRGTQGPETIAAAFDDALLAARISDRMIDLLIEDVVAWRDQGVEFGHVALNAAAADFRMGNFAERLLERLAAAAIPARQVQLEVTETVFLGRGAECVHRALEILSAAGVAIALDDFGTGYASLSHLRQYPVNMIKIDRSFVRDLGSTRDASAIVSAVISLGRNLNLEVVGEGVESPGQEQVLRQLGCHYGQGFLYAKAVPGRNLAAEIGRLNGRRDQQWARPRHAA